MIDFELSISFEFGNPTQDCIWKFTNLKKKNKEKEIERKKRRKKAKDIPAFGPTPLPRGPLTRLPPSPIGHSRAAFFSSLLASMTCGPHAVSSISLIVIFSGLKQTTDGRQGNRSARSLRNSPVNSGPRVSPTSWLATESADLAR
jgi:hypothetical protein